MLQLKFTAPKRKLNFPIYSISTKEYKPKSCFIDRNRIDTVKPMEENTNKKTVVSEIIDKQKL